MIINVLCGAYTQIVIMVIPRAYRDAKIFGVLFCVRVELV